VDALIVETVDHLKIDGHAASLKADDSRANSSSCRFVVPSLASVFDLPDVMP